MAYCEYYLNGCVKFKELVNFIVQKYDVGAKTSTHKEKFSSYYEDGHYTKLGSIKFKHNNVKIKLHYSYSNFLTRHEKDAAEKGNKKFWLSNKTKIFVNDDPVAQSIIDEILLHFGGTKVTKKEIEYIKAQPDESIKPILTVSQKKLRKTFGGVYVEVK